MRLARRKLVAFLLALSGSSPAAAQLPPIATPEQLVAATNACVAATSTEGTDVEALKASGWNEQPAEVTERQGPPAEMKVYAAVGNPTLILSLASETRTLPGCVAIARMSRLEDYPAIKRDFVGAFGEAIGGDEDAPIFRAGEIVISLSHEPDQEQGYLLRVPVATEDTWARIGSENGVSPDEE